MIKVDIQKDSLPIQPVVAKDNQSVGTISMLDGMIFKGGVTDNQSNIDNKSAIESVHNQNLENVDNHTIKTANSKTTLSFRERKSFKAGFIKPLKIQTPGLEELIKKPNPIITKDVETKFINNLPMPKLDMNARQSNAMFSSSTPNPLPGFKTVLPREPFT